MTRAAPIVGWKAIAVFISDVTGLSVSGAQAIRMAHRAEDPLPTFPLGRGRRRPRAVRQRQLEEWVRREFPELVEDEKNGHKR